MIGSVDIIRFCAALPTVLALSQPAAAFDHNDFGSLEASLMRYAADLEAGRSDDVALYRLPGIAPTETPHAARVIDISFRLDTVAIETTSAGTDYAFLPTLLTTSIGPGPDTRTETVTFALQDTGRWYFLDLSNRRAFRDVQSNYPEFKSITPPEPGVPK